MSENEAVRGSDEAETEPAGIDLPEDGREPAGSEADLLEQARVVREEQVLEPGERPDDVPEADWYEQRVTEDLDEEER